MCSSDLNGGGRCSYRQSNGADATTGLSGSSKSPLHNNNLLGSQSVPMLLVDNTHEPRMLRSATDILDPAILPQRQGCLTETPSEISAKESVRDSIVDNSGQIRAWSGYSKAPGVSQEPVYDVVQVVPKAGFEPAREITPNGF